MTHGEMQDRVVAAALAAPGDHRWVQENPGNFADRFLKCHPHADPDVFRNNPVLQAAQRRANELLTPGGSAGSGLPSEGSSPSPGAAGVKFDAGKNRLGLLPPRALEAVGRVLTYGAEKYTARDAAGNVTRDGAGNWRKVPELQRRYTDGSLRHILADMRGEAEDPETGMSHLAHAICCLLFRLEDRLMDAEQARTDDIPF